MNQPAHFEGQSAKEHLKKARKKGAIATSEIHGTEMSGALNAFCECARTLIALLLVTYLLLTPTLLPLLLFSLAFTIFSFGRSSLIAWSRLERLHRLIEDERHEITHHREQEREELTEMYQAKGLSGKLLTDVIDVLMADDNRLLMVMLEEELGLPLESFEHPLLQGLGAALGCALSAALGLIALHFGGLLPLVITAFLISGITAYLTASRLRIEKIRHITWHISLLFVTGAAAYFLGRALL